MKRRKFLTIAMTCFLLIMLLPVTVMASGHLPFTDVEESEWYHEHIVYVYENELMNGITPTTFEPDRSLTRAMFVTILGRMDGVNISKYPFSSFRDVPRNQWYTPYVQWASKNGIVTGYSENKFGPDDPVTREQMATIISRYLDAKEISLPNSKNRVNGFKDAASVSNWARKGLETMRRTGIITGNGNGCFYPLNTASRAEAAAVFARLKQAISQGSVTEPIFVQANVLQEYKGKIYTVLDLENLDGVVKVPGFYMTSLIVYEDHIYYTADVGTGGGPTTLTRMNLDGSDKTVLVNDLSSIDNFCIYDDVLYYTSFIDWDIQFSKSLDLNTLQSKNEKYYFLSGTDEVWIVSDGYYSEQRYCSYPEFVQVQELPERSGWTPEGIFGVHEDNMYYFAKYSIFESSVYDTSTEEVAAGPYVDSYYRYFIAGNGLYYREYDDDYAGEYDDNYWHRYDLITSEETIYDLGDMEYFSAFDEINGNLYLSRYIPGAEFENTEGIELNLETGELKSLGIWFES